MAMGRMGRRILKVSAIVLAAIAVLAGVWWLIRLVMGIWQAFLFYTYVIMGIAVVSLGLFATLSARRKAKRSVGMIWIGALSSALSSKSPIKIVRGILGMLASLAAGASAWPLLYVDGIARRVQPCELGTPQFDAKVALSPQVRLQSVALLLWVAFLYLLAAVGLLRGHYGRAFLALVIVHITSQHVAYLATPTSLVPKLRRSPQNPFMTSAILGFSHLLSIVLLLNGIRHFSSGQILESTNLQAIILDLLSFQKFKLVFHRTVLPFNEYLIPCIGTLLYITVLRTFIRFREFTRTDDDFRSIAFNHVMLGRFNDALAWLSRTKSRNPMHYFVEIMALCGVNQIQKAQGSLRMLQGGADVEAQGRWTYVGLIASMAPLPKHTRVSVLKKAMQDSVSDKLLMSLAGTLSADPEDFVTVLTSPEYINSYPLTYCAMLIQREQLDELRSFLPGIAESEDEGERMVLDFFRLLVSISCEDTSLEEDRHAFERWCDGFFVRVSQYLSSGKIDELDRGLAITVSIFARDVLTDLLPERLEECDYLIQKLKEHPDSKTQKMLESMLNQVRLLRSREDE